MGSVVDAVDDPAKSQSAQQRFSSLAEFVYTTCIKTTPEQLWQALTDPAFTSR